MVNSTENKLPTNTEVAIIQTLEMLKRKFITTGGVEISNADIEIITMYLQNIANAKKMDVINQINNLK